MGEADRLVSFFSRAAGRMRGVASGARRPKSRFGSTLELLSYVKIWYYERETRDLVRISQCELIESYLGAQKDYSAGLALALVSEVAELVLPEKEAADPVFRLILTSARALTASADVQVVVAYYSLWMVRLAGWLPDLEHCVKCGRPFGSKVAHESFEGSLKCSDCGSGGRSITSSSIGLAKQILATKLQVILEAKPPSKDATVILNFSLDIVERQAERRLASRKLLEEAP